MARDSVAIMPLVTGGGTVGGTVALNATNGLIIPALGKTRNLFLYFRNTGGTAGTATLKAGVNPPAFRQGIGDAAITCPAGSDFIVQIESARHVQADGSVYIDLTPAGFTGYVAAYRLAADAS